MAGFTRTHGDSKPVFAIDTLNGSGSATTGVPVMIQGPKLDFFNIDLGGDIAGELGTGGVVELVKARKAPKQKMVCRNSRGFTSGTSGFATGYPTKTTGG